MSQENSKEIAPIASQFAQTFQYVFSRSTLVLAMICGVLSFYVIFSFFFDSHFFHHFQFFIFNSNFYFKIWALHWESILPCHCRWQRILSWVLFFLCFWPKNMPKKVSPTRVHSEWYIMNHFLCLLIQRLTGDLSNVSWKLILNPKSFVKHSIFWFWILHKNHPFISSYN